MPLIGRKETLGYRKQGLENHLIFYKGAEKLVSRQRVFWKVRGGRERQPSPSVAHFTVGMLGQDDWKAD